RLPYSACVFALGGRIGLTGEQSGFCGVSKYGNWARAFFAVILFVIAIMDIAFAVLVVLFLMFRNQHRDTTKTPRRASRANSYMYLEKTHEKWKTPILNDSRCANLEDTSSEKEHCGQNCK